MQIRLVTSRETRRWVLPKGWPMKGVPPHKAAAREAYEEAGLLGTISRTAFGMYGYDKRLSTVRSVACDVMVFPLKVKRYLKKWPERSQRIGFWFTIESAAAAVHEEELRALILRFGEVMAARHAAKLEAAARSSLGEGPAVKAKKLKKSSASPASADPPVYPTH
ncbi:NUDIX hydrolase [Aquabacter spiritensis]|uniref:Putative NUDIX family NTP pyrophosphohydrolase n=1 Tax=Aquabacter spiritensis TaxID=933073 RepID=A0A4V2UYI4_9HYPH|nr:NUDIX domain-containing protein [Aquabacter spiritensis]TCT07538.1 putative NUDIX family NTP pyrophosphohydrolase [Aquabacter spiritensis]